MAKLLVLLFLFSCQHVSTTYSHKGILVENDHGAHLKEDLDTVLSRPEQDEVMAKIKKVNIHPNNCVEGQVACVYQDSPGVIFLSQDYFSLHPLERRGSLIHEAAHHVYGYEHVPCASRKIANTDCDSGFQSPFGEELRFYLESLQSGGDRETLLRLIPATQARIN